MSGMSQTKVIEGHIDAKDMRIGVVVSRFNAFITEKLLEGAVDAVVRNGGDAENVTVAWVPGAFEMPLVARALGKRDDIDAVVCLGAVIKGSTAHFDYVAGEAASGLARAGWDVDKPVIFGVLTTDTIEQSIERAGTKLGNKGYEAALAAVETVRVLQQIAKG
jgi:6,7-dimethyl-8-ribityllumazine synthase